MGIEIERKFLVTGDGWRTAAHKVVPMAQGYLNDLAAMDTGAMKASVRVRIQGDAPHATVWINGLQISDATDSANHALDGMTDGPIAIQIHGGDVRWQPGGFWRWRNLAIKELPR